jgi:hypothetical protein
MKKAAPAARPASFPTVATPTPAGSAASSSFGSTARAISADDLDLRDGEAVPEAAHAEQAVIGALLRDSGGVDRKGALFPAQFLRAASPPDSRRVDAPDRRRPGLRRDLGRHDVGRQGR